MCLNNVLIHATLTITPNTLLWYMCIKCVCHVFTTDMLVASLLYTEINLSHIIFSAYAIGTISYIGYLILMLIIID